MGRRINRNIKKEAMKYEKGDEVNRGRLEKTTKNSRKKGGKEALS